MTLLKDLIDIPIATGADDFVVKLTDARARATSTLRDYVPTPAVVARMNDALGRIDEAFKQRKSLATYLHGSFGSGKSHFMAVLTLLLEGAPDAWTGDREEPVAGHSQNTSPWLSHVGGAVDRGTRAWRLSQASASEAPQRTDGRGLSIGGAVQHGARSAG